VKHLAVVTCGVLEWNFRRAIERTPNRVDLIVLPAGLHGNPGELRRRVQTEIDRLDGATDLDGIVIGYGLCGRGVVGLRAGRVPLAVPRCEDCTAIFLGSQRRYRAEFAQYPGTRYFTCGWIRGQSAERFGTARNRSLYDPSYQDLVQRFGEDNARFIVDFRESWRRNYRRAAYIRFEGDPAYAAQSGRVQALAEAENWRYEELDGDETLFDALVTGEWERYDILVVRPGERVVSAPGADLMGAGQDVEGTVRAALARLAGRQAAERPPRQGLGLGIDAGGTYTDSVIYDFATRQVLSWSKAPTTHHDLVIGIAESLAGLDRALLGRVERVALSTTLATNAIVEGKGQPVGMLLMGIDEADLDRIAFRLKRLIPGRMSIEGLEHEAVDEGATRQSAEALAAAGAQAFAVSGHAAVINPAHELAVARIVWDATGLPVVCGHSLTRDLNLFRRANTAGLNARLLPLIERLIRAVRRVLGEMGLSEPRLYVVCGDGTQLLDRYAEQFPVETLLSGPAASVMGALTLSGRREAIIADMGGTTLDVAVVKDGAAVLSREGAEVGGFQTCVKAMRIHTVGLGGDSEIHVGRWPELCIGPRRIIPLSVLAARHPTVRGQLRSLLDRDLPSRGVDPTVFIARGHAPAPPHPDEHEAALLAALEAQPLPAVTVADRLGLPSPRFLRLHRLEETGAIVRAGLTPTDLFHAEGTFNAFSTEAAVAAFDLCAQVLGVPEPEIRQAIWRSMQVGIARQIVLAELEETGGWRPEERTARFIIEQLFQAKSSGFRLALGKPVVPIGAPVGIVFPALAEPCGAEVAVPPFAAVANAVGAIAGDVLLAEQVEIVPATDGAFQVQSRIETVRVFAFEAALETATDLIRRGLAERARLNDVAFSEPDFEVRESRADTPLGPLFLGLRLTGRLRA
jgi:N-methylhydantoinase A/oxoprolinase/acetone carboxylase beta subunit